MAAKRIKRKPKRRSRAVKGRAKSGRGNVRSGKRTEKREAQSEGVTRGRRDNNAERSVDKRVRPSERISEDATPERESPPVDYDEEDIEEYAALWGVSYEEAEAVLEESTDVFANVPLDDYGRPDIDYMSELADLFDVEVSDLYDLYYGCTPGSSE